MAAHGANCCGRCLVRVKLDLDEGTDLFNQLLILLTSGKQWFHPELRETKPAILQGIVTWTVRNEGNDFIQCSLLRRKNLQIHHGILPNFCSSKLHEVFLVFIDALKTLLFVSNYKQFHLFQNTKQVVRLQCFQNGKDDRINKLFFSVPRTVRTARFFRDSIKNKFSAQDD